MVGIGVNTSSDIRRFPAEIAETATTLRREIEKEVDNDLFLAALLHRYDDFYRDYKARRLDGLFDEYRQICSTLGEEVAVDTAKGTIQGTALDISPRGALVVGSEGGRVEIFEGTVRDTRGRS